MFWNILRIALLIAIVMLCWDIIKLYRTKNKLLRARKIKNNVFLIVIFVGILMSDQI